MKKKVLGLGISIILISIMISLIVNSSLLATSYPPQKELDFTVSGTNDCLRFLHREVKTVYVPIRTAADEQWQLTIECTQMPGAGGWTELYLYKGYWDGGENNTCIAEDIYPIISKIETTDFQVRTNSTFTETFGGSTPQSYTVFFIFPPGGQGTYNVKLTKTS